MSKRLVALAALLLLPGIATGQPERTDLQILNDVSAAVRSYPQFTVFDEVAGRVDGGVVTLTGRVTMRFKIKDIEGRVARVAGVRQIDNRIRPLPASPSDDRLRYAISRAIYRHPAFWHYAAMADPPIHIIVEHGRVTLTGVVHNEMERNLARSLASSLGAWSVSSQLRTDEEARALVEKRH